MSVYFMTCRDANAVKIGFSFEPYGRLREIQIGCPLPVKLEAVLPGTMEDERAFHARFVDERRSGEWFTITPMIEAIIAANPAPEKAAPNPRFKTPKRDTLIARIRLQLRVTQAELASMVGITTDKLRMFERGMGRPWRHLPPELEAKLLALVDEVQA